MLMTEVKADMKVFRIESKNPPRNTFEIVKIGRNIEGVTENVEIYESYLEAPSLISWSKVCDSPELGLYNWDTSNQNITEVGHLGLLSPEIFRDSFKKKILLVEFQQILHDVLSVCL